MDINNFALLKNKTENKVRYGIKFVPERALNKCLDYMLVILDKNRIGKDIIYVCFKKSSKSNICILFENEFKKYMNFLECNYYRLQNNINIKDKFFFQSKNYVIELKTLNNKYIKFTCINTQNKEGKNIFFVVSKEELSEYIIHLKGVYLELDTINKFKKAHKKIILKKEKNELYLNTLYVLANEALDERDKEKFYLISNEIQRNLN